MGSEPVEELPDDLEAWVAERAADDDTSRADVVRRLMAAHQVLDEDPDGLADADVSDLDDGVPEQLDPDGDEVDDLDSQIEELAGRVEELEGDLDEKITDVRERVIQVKREADAKAPADHDHPAIERRIDEGFENYEEILEYLTERTEALEDGAEDRSAKLRRVANAVVDLRRRLSILEGEFEKHAAVAELREAANRRGISEAACGSCGESVRIGLLDEPTCPHCESAFEGVESGGWFRSNRLTVGDRPALESAPTASDADGPPDHTDSSPSGSDGHGDDPTGSSAESAGSDAEATDAEGRDAASEASEATPDEAAEARKGSGADSDDGADPDGFAGEPADGGGDEKGKFNWAAPPGDRSSEGTESDGEEDADR